MSIRRIRAMAKKEFLHMRRDIWSLILTLFVPLMMIFLFGYALSLDVDRIPTMVLDRDGTPNSRDLISRLADSRYFDVVRYIDRMSDIDTALAKSEALVAIVIPENFGSKVKQGIEAPVQFVFDGTDSNTASIGIGYVKAVVNGLDMSIQAARIKRAGLKMADMPIDARIRVWYNPEMKSRNFIIPGLTAVIMMAICALMTAMTITRERETGTMEQLISTPITSRELILGKLLPYVVVGMADMTLVVGAGVVVFGVPFRGSYLDLFVASLLFLIGVLGWGLLISAVAKTQLQASQIAMISAFLPSFLLSGFIYPIDNMPVALQVLTHIVPARYFVDIMRGLFLQGVRLDTLWPEVLALCIYSGIVLNLAAKRFQKRL